MATKAQRTATKMHRRRVAARGLMRLEVQASKQDAELIRALAAALRTGSNVGKTVRSTLASALSSHVPQTAFDVFGSGLSDETFAGVFEQPRETRWRDLKL
jgi:hypothetical protein